MKIAFIVEAFPVLSQTFVLDQIIGLIERGHEVDIYAQMQDVSQKHHPDVEKYRLRDRTYYQPLHPHNKLLRLLQALWLLVSCFFRDPILVLRSLNLWKYGKDAASLRLFYSVIPFLGDRRQYDIIQCHFGLLGCKGMRLRQIGAIQGTLVTAFHGVDISQNVQLLGDDLYNELFENGDLFLPACDHWKRRLLELGCQEERIITHRMGIDTQQFAFLPRTLAADEPIRLVTVARLTEKKGIEYSIQAVAQMMQQHPDLTYTIIGSGSLKENIQALIHHLKLDDIVTLAGSKTRQDVIEILKQSHLFLHPSVTACNGDQEASPVSIQEAMAMGLPVLSTYHGGIPELVEDTVSGFLVPERDADALAEKLGYLLSHPEQWTAMGQAGRARIEQQHDINRLSDRLISIYQQCLTSGKQSQPDEERDSATRDRSAPLNV